MQHLYTLLLGFLILFIIQNTTIAQDIHWSQFGNAPLEMNPALTSNFNGDIRLGANLRTQWNSVPVGYETYSVWGDMAVRPKFIKKGRLGVGLLLSRDQAGFSDLRSIVLRPSVSYTHALTNSYQTHQHQLGLGIGLMVFNRRFGQDDLQFDAQYVSSPDGRDRFESSAPNGEAFDSRSTNTLLSPSIGINYLYQNRRKRTRFNLGGGLFHFNKPDVSFFDQLDVMLPIRFSLYGLGVWHLTDNIDLLTDANWQIQGSYDEIILRPALRIHLNRQHTRETSVDLGIRYRIFENSDAIVPDVCLNFRQFTLGLTYDLTLSDFTEANNGRGGPELSFIYIFKKVRPVPVNICPVY